MIGHPGAYFSLNWRAVTWVSNYSYPITTSCNEITVIGHLRCARVNQVASFFAVFESKLLKEHLYLLRNTHSNLNDANRPIPIVLGNF